MDKPKISIIIVNYCGKHLLEECLESLKNTDYKNYEIIIIDNNSNDGSVEFLNKNYPTVKMITLNKNYGFAEPNNIGAKVAKGKYLVFLNNDTKVTPNWLDELVKTLESDKTIVMGQSLLLFQDGSVDSSGDFVDSLGMAYSKRDIPEKMRYILSPRAACMIVRKDAFLDLGGFDESYFASFEDVELGWKAWLWGFKVMVNPKSIVYHKGGQTIKQISKTIEFHSAKNNIMLRLTNFGTIEGTKTIFLMFFEILRIKLLRKKSKFDQRLKITDMKTFFHAITWIIKNSKLINKKRKQIQSRQVRTNDDLKKIGLITK